MMPIRTKSVSREHAYRETGGFTLLEMIVSIGIFLIALTIILGALVAINGAARKARSERIVNDNLSTAIDSMSRAIRVGSNFHCGCGGSGDSTFPLGVRNCAMSDTQGVGGDICLAFEGQFGDPNNANDQIVYRLFGGRLERSVQSGAAGTYLPLTAPELFISSLQFYVYGTAPNEDQPTVTMVFRGSASTTRRTATEFTVQTSVSAYTPSLIPAP